MPDSFELSHLPVATLVVAIAYLLRGITGFGSGLVAIPLLALILPLPIVVPVIALLDLLASLSHGIGNRQAIHWREILALLPFSAIGVIAAIFLFRTIDEQLLRQALAVFLISYALYSLLAEKPGKRASQMWAVLWGGLGGVVNALFGTGGPFYVIYLKLRNLNKSELRATIAAILLLDGTIRLAGYTAAGLFTQTALLLVAAGVPLGGLAMYVGGRIQTDLSPRVFQRAISVLLLISGAALLLQQ